MLGIDASDLAIHQARFNARMNDLQGIVNFACGDVFDLLPDFEKKGKQFDVVILDPVSYTHLDVYKRQIWTDLIRFKCPGTRFIQRM